MGIYVKIAFIAIFSFFPSFQSRFYRIHWFFHIASSNTETDDVTNYIIFKERIFNTNL